MKIYTKTGDAGQTSLYNGGRIDKCDIRVESYGTIDELSSYIGLCLHYVDREQQQLLFKIQKNLFYIGAELASLDNSKLNRIISAIDIEFLENNIDNYMNKIEKLNHFIMPGTSIASANLHIARSICRRAERIIIKLNKEESINECIMKYMNRLSDLLYSLAMNNESELIPMEF